jgi:hypothetical protein
VAQDARVAARLSSLKRVASVAAVRAQNTGSVRAQPPAELRASDVAALHAAGWDIRPTSSRAPSTTERAVFHGADGRVLVDTGSVTVRFADSASRDDIDGLLARHGYRVSRRLAMAPNLFTAAPCPDAKTAVGPDVARALGEEAIVQFAEPAFTEVIGPRR